MIDIKQYFKEGVLFNNWVIQYIENDCLLKYKEHIVMVNTQEEQQEMLDVNKEVFGDVFIGGLGYGLLPLVIQDNENVKSITIVEKEEQLIEEVKKRVPFNKKIKIIHDDIFSYETQEMFDYIYLDIWFGDERNQTKKEMLQEYIDMEQKYIKKLKQEGIIRLWNYNNIKN